MRQAARSALARLRRGPVLRDVTPEERRLAADPDALFAYLRSNGVREHRDALALAASHGRFRLDALLAEARRPMSAQAFRARFDLVVLKNLATLLADQPAGDGDGRRAIDLIGAIADRVGVRDTGKELRFRLLELLVERGEARDLDRLIADLHIARDDAAQQHLLRANAGEWLPNVNAMFAGAGLEPVEIRAGDGSPFDRIASTPADHRDGPLVTVVIPTYAPGPRIATAIESLLAQSHRTLQILVMDDASPVEHARELDRWRDRDPRIDVVQLTDNNGPYRARNIAVAEHAHGEYVTIHDDDDWSHPRKIELQVAHLEANRDEVAVMGNGVRVSDDLRFGRVNGNPVWTQHALSSLLVRREVFETIGYWDVINRSADAEFNDRIRAWTGRRIPVAGPVPTTFYRVRWDSLSASEFDRGYMDQRRRWYYQSYLAWHERETAAGRAPYLPVDDRESRPFSVPADFVGSRHGDRTTTVDLLVSADFRRKDAELTSARAALAEGKRVALRQIDDPTTPANARIKQDALDLATDPRIAVVSARDDVHEV